MKMLKQIFYFEHINIWGVEPFRSKNEMENSNEVCTAFTFTLQDSMHIFLPARPCLVTESMCGIWNIYGANIISAFSYARDDENS